MNMTLFRFIALASFLPCLVFASDQSNSAARAGAIYKKLSQSVQEYEAALEDIRKASKAIESEVYTEKKRAIELLYDTKLKTFLQDEKSSQKRVIAQSERFVKRHPNAKDLTPNALFILASLYFEREKSQFVDSFSQSDEGSSGVWFKRAIEVYKQLINRFPNYIYADAAYYMLGVGYQYDGEEEDAEETWRKLLELYPHTRFKEEVTFRVGDIAFSRSDWTAAKADFTSLLNDKASKLYDKVLYKIAWINYMLGEYDLAIAEFANLLDLGLSDASKSSVLDSEAKEYIAISFFEKNKSNGRAALNDFAKYRKQKGPKPYYRDIYVHLGDILANDVEYINAANAYQLALALDPKNIANPDLAYKVIQLYEEANKKGLKAKAVEYFVDEFSPDGEWVAAQEIGAKEVLKALEKNQQLLLNLALESHEKARDGKGKEEQGSEKVATAFESARTQYSRYIKSFPAAKNLDKILLYFADASYETGHYADAKQAYEQVRDWPVETEYRKEAALGTIHSIEHEIEKLQKDKKLKSRRQTNKRPKE